MGGGVREPSEGAEELGTYGKDTGTRGRQPTGVGYVFKAVVQAVILFESETWFMAPHMGRALGSFQHRFARWITGRHPKRPVDGIW